MLANIDDVFTDWSKPRALASCPESPKKTEGEGKLQPQLSTEDDVCQGEFSFNFLLSLVPCSVCTQSTLFSQHAAYLHLCAHVWACKILEGL